MAYNTALKGFTNSGTSATTASGTTTTGFMAIGVVVRATATVTSVSDSKGNSWTQLGTSHTVNSVSTAYVFYCENATGGASHTFTANLSTTGTAHIVAINLTGRATSSAIEASGYGADSGNTTSHSLVSTGAYTSGSDVLAFIFDDNFDIHGLNDTWTAGSGWTLPVEAHNSDGRDHPTGGFEYIANGAGTTVTAQFSNTNADQAGAFVFAVKAAGGTAATASPTTGSVVINGIAPLANSFTNVRIREVLINESGTTVGNRTGVHLMVWYAGLPVGAPDLSYSDMTTDPNGTTSWSIATGSLQYNQTIFYVAHDGHASLSEYTCSQIRPTYS